MQSILITTTVTGVPHPLVEVATFHHPNLHPCAIFTSCGILRYIRLTAFTQVLRVSLEHATGRWDPQ